MMPVTQYNYPTTILFGEGSTAELGSRLAVEKRPYLLVTDPGLVMIGLAKQVQDTLESAGLSIVLHSEVHANPIEEDVDLGVTRYKDSGAHGIIALGGGSAMDVAKVIAVMATHPPPLLQYDDGKGGDKNISNPLPPIYAIATTAGTGSEVGRAAVIISKETGVKTVIFHPTMLPTIAVLDPTLTVGLPANLTAATGLDAFTHGLEAYFAIGHHPIADSIAIGAMELVIANLPRAVSHGDDLFARGQMLIAATMGATAFQKGLGAIHSLAHPLSTRYGIHHGLANALLMPPVLAWQLSNKRSDFSDDLHRRHQRVARLFDPAHDAEALPAAITELNKTVGITDKLSDHGLVEADIPALAKEAFADGCHQQNPIALTESDLASAYSACL